MGEDVLVLTAGANTARPSVGLAASGPPIQHHLLHTALTTTTTTDYVLLMLSV